MSGVAGDDTSEGGAAAVAGTQNSAGAAGECSSSHSPCFEPCGGDPLGNWVLEAGCLGGNDLTAGCTGGWIEGTLGESSLRLMFTADGLRITGRESWEITASAPHACLVQEAASSCDGGVLFTSPLLFTRSRHLLTCQAGACGACVCPGVIEEAQPAFAPPLGWSTEGVQLTFGSSSAALEPRRVPYCVDGDVLWLGGGAVDGQTLTSYRFRKRSCTQTEPPCSERTPEECENTPDCRWGECVSAPGSGVFCSTLADFQCAEDPDCTWHADRCAPSGAPSCEFDRCEQMPGCEIGPPVARCVGNPWCSEFDASECNEPGCSVRPCRAAEFVDDLTSCGNLDAFVCEESPRCSSDGVQCEGTTRCSIQTDSEVCEDLGCEWESHCWGQPTRTCSSLPIEECHTLPGCQLEW